MFYERHLQGPIQKASNMFGAVLVAGARQVGKTTLLSEITPTLAQISLDDPQTLQTAIAEPGSLFKLNPPPVFVDEIQYAPGLFPYMKMHIDSTHSTGQFYLTGSQQFHMMKNVSESLAGRIGILNLLGLSLREISFDSWNQPFVPSLDFVHSRQQGIKTYDYQEIWQQIWRGSMPALNANPDYDWGQYYGSYVKTYIERDVRDLTQVGNELKFLQFMTVLASHTGQLLNLAKVAREIGISQPTADSWLSIMVASNLVYLLRPYSNNSIKRAIKTPKLYFLDTGLVAYLTRWNTPETICYGAMAGAFFETFVIAEVLKSYYNAGQIDPPLYFYRDRDNYEIDLVIWQGGQLHPVEIKKTTNPSSADISAFRILDKVSGLVRGEGAVICLADSVNALGSQNYILPVGMI